MSARLSLIPVALFAALAIACADNGTAPTSTDQARLSSGLDDGLGTNGAAMQVSCEKRPSRSKISVDGRQLAAGTYTARVTSGANAASAPGTRSVAGEVEFDFDSNRNNIAAGATPIPASFIQVSATPHVTGQILNAAGTVVRTLSVNCRVR